MTETIGAHLFFFFDRLNARDDLQKNLDMDMDSSGLHVSFIHPSSVASLRPPTFVMSAPTVDLEADVENSQKVGND